MSITLKRHFIDYGEAVQWSPPAGAATFYAWRKLIGTADVLPRWQQVGGFSIATDAAIDVPGDTELVLSADGLTATWQTMIAMFVSDPQLLMMTAQDAEGRLIARDVFLFPAPNLTPVHS